MPQQIQTQILNKTGSRIRQPPDETPSGALSAGIKQKEKKMRLTKNAANESLKIVMAENRRLKRENQRLNESLDELQRYKDEYKKLIGELNQIKQIYADKLAAFQSLLENYNKEWQRITNRQRTGR